MKVVYSLLFASVLLSVSGASAQADSETSFQYRPGRQVTCVVQDRFGRTYRGDGWSYREASNEAVRACHRYVSATCHVIRCN